MTVENRSQVGSVPRSRARSRASAKAAGSSFERLVADYLAASGFPFADRRVKSGAKDRGDVGGVMVHGQRVVLEAKNTARINLGTWAAEAELERVNDGALVGLIVHKRHGKGSAADQWVDYDPGRFCGPHNGFQALTSVRNLFQFVSQNA